MGIWIILRISFGNLELGEYILTQKKKKKELVEQWKIKNGPKNKVCFVCLYFIYFSVGRKQKPKTNCCIYIGSSICHSQISTLESGFRIAALCYLSLSPQIFVLKETSILWVLSLVTGRHLTLTTSANSDPPILLVLL